MTVNTATVGSNNSAQSLTINNANTQEWNVSTLYFRVQNPEGTNQTATVILFVIPLF